MSIKELKSEINRTFRVLGPDCGYNQNMTDLVAWENDKIITHEQRLELYRYMRYRYFTELKRA